MSDTQKKRRAVHEARLGRPDPGALRRDVLELMSACLPDSTSIELRTDEKTEYATVSRQLQKVHIEHLTTNSKKPRTPRNPLFAINAHHMFMRHSGANHKRETVAFSKRIQGVIYRHAVFQVWRNLVKPASLRRPTETPAQRLGVTDKRWSIGELLAARRFATRRRLRRRVADYYWGLRTSRFLRGERSHEPAFVG